MERTPTPASNANNTVFTVPPSTVRNIGDALLEKNISFKYYGDQWNTYVNDPYQLNPDDLYCNICNFFQYSTSIMTGTAVSCGAPERHCRFI